MFNMTMRYFLSETKNMFMMLKLKNIQLNQNEMREDTQKEKNSTSFHLMT